MTKQSHTQLLISLFRAVARRIFYIRSARLTLRICNAFLIIYAVYITVRFALYGYIPGLPDITVLATATVSCVAGGTIFIILHPCRSDSAIRSIDRDCACKDSLNAAYEIIIKNRDWHEWNDPVLQSAASHISNCHVRLPQSISFRISNSVAALSALAFLTTALCLFAGSPSGMAWRISRLKSQVYRQATILTEMSQDIFKQDIPDSKEDSVQLQRIAHDLRMLARTDADSTSQQSVTKLMGNISDLKNDIRNRLDVPPDIIKNLDKTEQTVQSLGSAIDQLVASKKTAVSSQEPSAQKGHGIGTQKGGDTDREYTARQTQRIGSEIVTIQKTGSSGTQSAQPPSAKADADKATASVAKIDGDDIEQPSPPVHIQEDTEKLTPVKIGTSLVASPVWFEAVPVTRRKHIQRYFSTTSDIREQK